MGNRRVIGICPGVVAVALGLTALLAGAQDAGKTHVKVNMVPARAEDVSSPEAIVLADYASISGGVGVARQWGRDTSLMSPRVLFVSISVDAKTGETQAHTSSQQEYVDNSDGFMVKEGFTEHELGHQTHRFGNVATVVSAYEGKLTSTGKLEGRGVNIYQCYYDGKRWWIASVVWDEERPGNPIPAELLGK